MKGLFNRLADWYTEEGTHVCHAYKLERLLAEVRRTYPNVRIKAAATSNGIKVGESLFGHREASRLNRWFEGFDSTRAFADDFAVSTALTPAPGVTVAEPRIVKVEVENQGLDGVTALDETRPLAELAAVARATFTLEMIEVTALNAADSVFCVKEWFLGMLGHGGTGPLYLPVRTFTIQSVAYDVDDSRLIDRIEIPETQTLSIPLAGGGATLSSRGGPGATFEDLSTDKATVTRPSPTRVEVTFRAPYTEFPFLWELCKVVRDPKTNRPVFSAHSPRSQWA